MPRKAAPKKPQKKPVQPQHRPGPTMELKPGQIVPDDKFYKGVAKLMEVLHAAGTFRDISLEVATAKLLKGVELGLHATQALTHIWITREGKLVADNAELHRALLSRAGVSIVPIEMTPQRCVVECTRGKQKGQFAYTIEEAQAQGLLGNKFWQTVPVDMLFARATTRAARAMGADVIAGLSYTAEEVGGASAGGVMTHGAPQAPVSPPASGDRQAPPPTEATAAEAGTVPGMGGGSADHVIPERREVATEKPPTGVRVADAGDALASSLGEIDGRKVTTTATITNSQGTKTVGTCGVTTTQLMALANILGRNEQVLRPVFNGFLEAAKLTKVTALTEQEAGMLIARLQGQGAPSNGGEPADTPPATQAAPAAVANTPLEAARQGFKALVNKLGLEFLDIEQIISEHLKKPLKEATAEEVVQATRDLQNLAVTNVDALKQALENARGIREAGAPGWESGGEF